MAPSQSRKGLNPSPSKHRRKHTSSFSFILANLLQFQEYCLDGDIQLMLRSPIRNFLTSRREPCFLLPLSPSTVHRATYFEERREGEKGGRQLFFASFLFSLVCRLPSIEIYSLPPYFPCSLPPSPPPSMNANSSIDTLSISHFVPPILACFLLPLPSPSLSLPGAVQCFGLSREELPVAAVA